MQLNSQFLAVGALLFNAIVAGEESVTYSTLNPWVSVDGSGSAVATFTPTITTISDIVTTVNTFPTSLGNTNPSLAPTAVGAYQVCGPRYVFCQPENGSTVYVGETYYVTWNTLLISNESFPALDASPCYLVINFVPRNFSGEYIFFDQNISEVQNATVLGGWAGGFYAWTIGADSLNGSSSQTIEIELSPEIPLVDNDSFTIRIAGPILIVKNRPHRGRTLEIAILTALCFLIIVAIDGFFLGRRYSKKCLGNITGGRGYGIRKSHSQRVGVDKKEVCCNQT